MLIVMVVIPGLVCFAIHYCIGGKLEGLALGIVNYEVFSIEDCWKKPVISKTSFENSTCKFGKVSCRFIKELEKKTVDQVRQKNNLLRKQ
jgi:hypothetical protein